MERFHLSNEFNFCFVFRYINCPIPGCTKGFTVKHHLTKHLQTVHTNKTNDKRSVIVKHNCYFDNCEAFFETAEELNNHLAGSHGLSILRSPGKRSRMELLFADHLKNQMLPPNNLYQHHMKTENPIIGNGERDTDRSANGITNNISPPNPQEQQQQAEQQQQQQSKPDESLKCHDCNVYYNSERDLRVHIFYKHPQKVNDHIRQQ